MKYLLFNKADEDYGADFDRVLVGSRERGIGAYEDKDAKILIKMHGNLVSEISEESYLELKKKLTREPVSYRLFGMQRQEADKNPNAVYAKKESKPAAASKGKAKDLVKVGKATVEDPLEGKD